MTERIRFDIGDREIRGNDYFAVIDPVFWTVSIYDGPEQYEKDLATGDRALLIGQRIVPARATRHVDRVDTALNSLFADPALL